MTGLQELKDAYEMIKNEYGYLCKSISLPYEDNEYTKFVFEYQGFPIKHSFSYLLYESPYGENDDVEFFDSENEVVLLWPNCSPSRASLKLFRTIEIIKM